VQTVDIGDPTPRVQLAHLMTDGAGQVERLLEVIKGYLVPSKPKPGSTG
jgi:hypothetical protein